MNTLREKISFNYETEFLLEEENEYKDWLIKIIHSEAKETGDLNFIFTGDNYLLEVNQNYLNHDTYTDIITFDYSEHATLSGDIFISVERVKDNAETFKVEFAEELLRVMSHGILHLAGYGDKEENETALMRKKEQEKINMFHVEQ